MDLQDASTQLHVVVDDGQLNRLLHQQLTGLGLNAHLLPAASDLDDLQNLVERQGGGQLTALHLYSHGAPGRLPFSQPGATPGPMTGSGAGWRSIGAQLQAGGDLLLYGCELARGSAGRAAIDGLARLSGRDVAASTDLTGAGGDWDLEYRSGPVATSLTDALTGLDWSGTLATTLNEPVRVRLHWQELGEGQDSSRKLGIYAAVGGSRSPQLFEFDTGGAGFYPAYGDSGTAPWWGPDWQASGRSFETVYDSGLTYTGDVVKTDVALFAGPRGGKPRLRADGVTLGQSSTISNAKQGEGTLWPHSPGDAAPPVSQVFYGDFGLAPKASAERIDSLSQQLRYGPGLVAGFRVHASARRPWVQFGLTRRDLETTATTFRLESDRPGATSRTGVPYYNANVTSGLLEIRAGRGRDRRDLRRDRTGFILDTGAQTTLHQSTEDVIPADLTVRGADTRIVDGARITARGKSISPRHRGQLATILDARAGAGAADTVKVQDTGETYLNTGIRPFLSHDVVYNLADARLTLIPRAKRMP